MNTLESLLMLLQEKKAVDAGVIFVIAAGNSNQTQVNPGDLDYNNYWNGSPGVALTECTHTEFGYMLIIL